MNDAELDGLLGRTAGPLTVRARTTARDMAVRSRFQVAERRPRRRLSRRRLTILAAVVGGAVLTAGTSLAAYQLSIPPFQTVPQGIQRATNPVAIDFNRVDGVQLHCLVFLEFRHLSAHEYQRVDRFIATNDWSGFGQRLDSHGVAARAQTPEAETDAVFDAMSTMLYREVSQVLPGLVLQRDEAGHPTYSG
jgi:hypothetical protein